MSNNKQMKPIRPKSEQYCSLGPVSRSSFPKYDKPLRCSSGNESTQSELRQPVEEEVLDRYVLAYQVLPQDISKELLEMDVDDMQRRLCKFFGMTNACTDLKQAAMLDYYTGAAWWAKEQDFNDQQMSGFFTAVHTLLNNIKEKQLSLVQNVTALKQMLVGIGRNNLKRGDHSGGMEFFNVAQGQAISRYIFSSLFQHYKLYEFLFHHSQPEEITGATLTVEVTNPATMPFPPPLDEGLEDDKHETMKTPPSPPPSAEEAQEVMEDTIESFIIDADVLSQLTAQDVKEVMESVTAQLLDGFQMEVATKLREKENAILANVNKIHNVP